MHHELRRAGHDAVLGELGVVGHPCQAEVRDLDTGQAVLQQQIGGLDVPVDQPLRVRRRQRGGSLKRDANGFHNLQWATAIDAILEGFALHVLHDQVGQAIDLVDAVNSNNVVVADGRGRLRLPREPHSGRGTPRQRGSHDLDRHQAVQGGIECLEHDAHAALSDHLRHLVIAEGAEHT